MIKKLVLAAVALAVLLVVGLVIVFMSIDSIAKAAIEKGGTYALGTDTTVSDVSVGVFKGEFSMGGLKVANPKSGSFATPHFLSLGTGATAVSLSTLRQPTVEISSFTLDKLDANIESKGGSTNYGAILENLKKLSSGDSSKPAPSSEGGKKFVIKQLTLSNITVHVSMGGSFLPGAVGDAAGKLTNVTIPIDRIELKDVGQGGGVAGTGVTMEQLAGIIVKAVLAAAAEKGGGLIPGDLLGDLNGKLSSLTSLDALSKGGMSIVAGAQGKVEEMGKKIESDVKKTVDDATKGIGGALKGVLPGGEKKK